MKNESQTLGEGVYNIRQIFNRILLVSIAVTILYVLACEIPAYKRRSELRGREGTARVQWLFSPFAKPISWFRSRSRVPKAMARFAPNEWLRPLEPLTAAQLFAHSNEDVRELALKLVPESELEEFSIVAEDGKCTDQVLRHVMMLPNVRSLTLCNIPITDKGIDWLLQMPQLRTLHIECSAEPSQGLRRLFELKNIETLGLMDCRCRVSNEVYRQIAMMPKLRELRLLCTSFDTDCCRVIASARSVESVCFAYMECELTLEQARIIAAMPKIRSVEFQRSQGMVNPVVQEYLEQRGLILEEEPLLGLPPT